MISTNGSSALFSTNWSLWRLLGTGSCRGRDLEESSVKLILRSWRTCHGPSCPSHWSLLLFFSHLDLWSWRTCHGLSCLSHWSLLLFFRHLDLWNLFLTHGRLSLGSNHRSQSRAGSSFLGGSWSGFLDNFLLFFRHLDLWNLFLTHGRLPLDLWNLFLTHGR